MRKFISEADEIVTLDEIRKEYEQRKEELLEDDGIENFEQFLNACMYYNNGTLTEILTQDTPCGLEQGAVELCAVDYAAQGEEPDVCEEWLNRWQQERMRDIGLTVTRLNIPA